MNGFEALQQVKDNMLKPIYEKRRHLGCEFCGTTFHGYYQNTGYQSHKVPNGKKSPHPTKDKLIIVHTYDDVFYPDCPNCGIAAGVRNADDAVAIYEHEQEKKRKNKAAAEKRKATRERKITEYWDRVRHVRANPHDATIEELHSFNFVQALLGMPYYGGYDNREKPCWEQGQNGRYQVKFNYVDKGTSRSGKTHYTRQWFDITDTDTGESWEAKR